MTMSRQHAVQIALILSRAIGARTSGPSFERRAQILQGARCGSEEIVERLTAEVAALKAELAETRAAIEAQRALNAGPHDAA